MIFALIRESFWNQLEAFCGPEYKRTGDPLYMFWRAYAQYKLGNTNGAINDLLTIQNKK